MSNTFGVRIADAQSIFNAKAAAAAGDLSLLRGGVIIILVTVLAEGFAVAGHQQRINDYR